MAQSSENPMQRRLILAIIALSFIARATYSSPINYIETGVGTGNLNGVAFSNATVTISGAADTTGITKPSGSLYVNTITSLTTVTVVGGGSDVFSDTITIFDVQSGLGDLGFSDSTRSADILDDLAAAFLTYDLSTPLGPVSGTPSGNPGTSFPTAHGSFQITSMSSVNFQAVAPEPASFTLIGLAGVGFLLRKRQRRSYMTYREEAVTRVPVRI